MESGGREAGEGRGVAPQLCIGPKGLRGSVCVATERNEKETNSWLIYSFIHSFTNYLTCLLTHFLFILFLIIVTLQSSSNYDTFTPK